MCPIVHCSIVLSLSKSLTMLTKRGKTLMKTQLSFLNANQERNAQPVFAFSELVDNQVLW